MEEIALFVLPMDPDGDENEQVKEIAEEKSQHAEDVNSSFTKRELVEEDAGKAPIRFTDVLGREYILPWTTMKNWTSLENTLVSAFLDIERIRPYVMNGNYRLIGPSNDVVLPKDWESLVQPGWEVQMQLWPVTETSEEDIESSLGVATEWNRQGLRARSPVLQPEVESVVKSRIPPIDNEVKEDNGNIVCICGTRHEAGLKLQCNTCKSWQHGICYYATEADRPDERDIVCICGTRHEGGFLVQCNTCKNWQFDISDNVTEADLHDDYQPQWLDADQAKERQKKQVQPQGLGVVTDTDAAADERASLRQRLREYEEEEEHEAHQRFLRRQEREEEEARKHMENQALSNDQKEKKEAEDRAKKEEQARIDSAMRERLERIGWSQQEIELALDPEKAEKEKKKKKKHRHAGDVYIEDDIIVVGAAPSLPDAPLAVAVGFPQHHVPVYPRIHRKYLDIETLEHYRVPWEFDRANPEYVILLRELDKYETDVLFEHTRRRRGQKNEATLADVALPIKAHYNIDGVGRIQSVATMKDKAGKQIDLDVADTAEISEESQEPRTSQRRDAEAFVQLKADLAKMRLRKEQGMKGKGSQLQDFNLYGDGNAEAQQTESFSSNKD
ncbi:hypothetical protein KCU98_g7017, partial [Aureobasidium melanogenum]